MRRLIALLVATLPATVGAQDTASNRQSLPRDVRREVVDRWNAAPPLTTVRVLDRLEINSGREIDGDVFVIGGPLSIAGHVRGGVVAINADVTLRPSARIDGDLLVVGGEVFGRNTARIGGTTRIYRQPLLYRQDGERIEALDDEATGDESWWRRFERRSDRSWSELLRIVQAGPYNRVEGLPINLGPVIHRRTSWGSLQLEAYGVLRTASSFASDGGEIGDNLRAEVRVGHNRGIGVGGTAFNIVDPIESWQLSDLETALAAFVSRRDYRDYYQRHGGTGYLTLYGARNLSFTAAYGEERWTSARDRNAFTLFNASRPWRANPRVDEGLFHIASTRLSFDTRTDFEDPWSGWYLNADLEHGRGVATSAADISTPRRIDVGAETEYTRGMFDFRRYNRLGPDGQLNMRLVLGGWLGGGPLPIERRLSADGPGALPGFDFRSVRPESDVATCTVGGSVVGRPAECDRIALAQIEYRGDLRLNLTGHLEDWPRHYSTGHGDAVWVVFVDAGRGWKVGPPDGAMYYTSGSLPELSTFRSDVGLGLDISGIGIYAAKSVSTPSEPVNVFVRLRHRF